jgi:SulP family sulfate permease
MAGCAMIGQSVINIKSGGRGRLSTFSAGCFLMFMILVLGDWVQEIPMAALVAVMIMVAIGTFSWASLKNLRTYPISSNLVMLTTVIVVVFTHNLAQGVFVGVLMASLIFAYKISRLLAVESDLVDEGVERIYRVYGQVFFVSADTFMASFDFKEVVERVRIDLTAAHFWDSSAVAALDKVVLKFRREGTEVELVGLNEASATIVDTLAIHNKPDALERMSDH